MEVCNTLLDDVAAVIGFTATNRLVAWYGGRHLYIPYSISDDHLLVKILGAPAARRLVKEFGGDPIKIQPPDVAYQAERRRMIVWRMLKESDNQPQVVKDASKELGISTRRVQQIIQGLKNDGLIGP